MKMIIFNEVSGVNYSVINGVLYELPNSSPETMTAYGIDSEVVVDLLKPFDTITTVTQNTDGSYTESTNTVTEFSVYDYISENPTIKVYNSSDKDVIVSEEVEGVTLYTEWNDDVELVYYTDDITSTSAKATVTEFISPLDTLTGDIEVVTWSNQSNTQTLVADGILNLQPTTVYAKGDISMYGVDVIESVSLSAIGEGKIAVSNDSGLTYLKHDGFYWVEVTSEDDGMSFSDFNQLTSEQLTELIENSDLIRFRYYLTLDTSVDKLDMNVSMLGSEKIAPTSSYSYTYDKPTKTITYTISKSGTYTINYMDA